MLIILGIILASILYILCGMICYRYFDELDSDLCVGNAIFGILWPIVLSVVIVVYSCIFIWFLLKKLWNLSGWIRSYLP